MANLYIPQTGNFELTTFKYKN